LTKETDNNTKSAIGSRSNRPPAEREEIDSLFKSLLTFNFGQLEIPIQTQVEVSRLSRTMDALVVIEHPDHLLKVRLETPFGHFRIHNQIEFKGKNEPLTIYSYHLILGRAHLYLGEKETSAFVFVATAELRRKLQISEMTVTIISACKPINVLRHCPDDVRWEEIAVGHYVK